MISFRTCQNLDTVATQLLQGLSHSSFSQGFLIKSQGQVRFTPWQLQSEPSKSGCRLWRAGTGVSLPFGTLSYKEDLTGHCDRRDRLSSNDYADAIRITSSTFLRLQWLNMVSFQLCCKHALDIGTWFLLLNPDRCTMLPRLLQRRPL